MTSSNEAHAGLVTKVKTNSFVLDIMMAFMIEFF